jgi:hypothetical protein
MDGMVAGRFSPRNAACIHVVFALFVQFAPSIHALSPHEHPTSSCKHPSERIHFETLQEGDIGSPCAVCTQLLGRQALLLPIGVYTDEILCVRSIPPSPQVDQGSSVLKLPDSRGPPPAL